jgi:hypothetical protein
LGVLLGVTGAVVGGYLAYGDAKALWNRHIAFKRFESVMTSPTMRKVGQAVRDDAQKDLDGSWATMSVSVGVGGIKEVTADRTGTISLIELSTGESVQRVEPPSMGRYLIPLLYPVLGFLLPWGAVRAVTWVGSGLFVPTSER